MIARDEESLTNAELERGRGAQKEFSDSSRELFLGLPEGKDFGRVDLQSGRMTGSLDESVGKKDGEKGEAAGFQSVHCRDQVGID